MIRAALQAIRRPEVDGSGMEVIVNEPDPVKFPPKPSAPRSEAL